MAEFAKKSNARFICIEGLRPGPDIDNEVELAHFAEMLALQCGTPIPTPKNWLEAFQRLAAVVRDGNRTLYSANERSALYEPLCALVDKSENPIELLLNALAKSDAGVAFVYGSRAKGSARTDSDYDLFVIGDCGLRQLSALLMPLREKVGVEINPYVVTHLEFRRRRKANDHFLKDVMGGKKIFVKGGPDELGAMEG